MGRYSWLIGLLLWLIQAPAMAQLLPGSAVVTWCDDGAGGTAQCAQPSAGTGTSLADDGDFVAGTTAGTPAMGFYQSAVTNVTDGDAGTLGITTERWLKISIEQDNVGIGGGTSYTEDVATANPIVGTATLMERDDALTTVTPAEVDWIGLRGTAEGALWVQDFNSDAILSDTTAILADTANMDTNLGTVASDTTAILADTAAIQTAVELIDNAISGAGFNITQLGGAAVPIGAGVEATALRVTVATDSTGVVSVDDNGGELTVNYGSGTFVVGDGAGALNVICDSGCAGGTQYAEDAVHASGNTGTLALAVRNDTLAALAGTDGDNAPLQVSATGALFVNVAEGNGFAEDATHTTADGVQPAGAVRNDVLAALAGTDGDYANLQVNDIGALFVTGEHVEDAVHATGDYGHLPLAVRNDTLAALGGTDGDYAPLQVNASGALYIQEGAALDVSGATVTVSDGAGAMNVIIDSGTTAVTATNLDVQIGGSDTLTVAAHAVTNAGTFATQVDGDALTALQLIDNIVHNEDDPSANLDPGSLVLARRTATPADTSGADLDYEALQMDNGRLWTSATIDAALPAGTNAIGKLAANSGVDIGDVDILSIAAGDNNIGNVDIVSGVVTTVSTVTSVTALVDITGGVVPGVGATDLGKAEDALHTTGDTGVLLLGVENADQAALTAGDKDYTGIAVSAEGNVLMECITGCSGGTQHAEDDPRANLDIGMLTLVMRDDVLEANAEVGADLDYMPMRSDNFGALWVTLTDASGAGVDASSIGGGTQHNEDDLAANLDTGNLMLMLRDDTPTASTAGNGDYEPPHLDGFGSQYVTLTDAAGAAVDASSLGGGTEFNEDTAHSTGAAGKLLLGVENADQAAMTAGDKDYGAIALSAEGNVLVEIITDNASLATSAGQLADGHNVALSATSDVTLQVADGDVPGGAGVLTANVPRVTIATDDEVNNLLGTIDTDTGALVVALDCTTGCFGPAGTADADVLTVQGIASMTALVVDGSGVTQPVSGTVTANPASGTIDTVTTVTTVTGVTNWGGAAIPLTTTQADNLANTLDGLNTTTFLMGFDGTTWDRLHATAGDLHIHDGGNTITVDGTITATATNLDVQIGGSDTLTVAAHAVTNAGTFVVQEDGAALTALQLIDNLRSDPCADLTPNYAKIDIVDTTTTEIINESASDYVHICSIVLVTNAANNVAIVEDATDACADPDAGVVGGVTAAEGFNLAANGGLTFGNGRGTIFKTASTDMNICIIASASTQLSGGVTYVYSP